jgi:phosphatidyl-myo-inositol dimannoside synthase
MASTPMKVLFISRACSNASGGMERFSYDLINTASSNSKLSVEKIIHGGSRKTSPLFVFLVIPKALIAARKSDFIHLGDPMLSIVGWLIKLVLHKKVIVTVHGLDVSYPNVFYQLYLRLFFRFFDFYLPISEAVSKELGKHSVGGQVVTINPGISNDYYDPSISRSDITQVISGVSSDSIYLLTTGRLVKRKGHEWFISNVLPQLPSHVHYVVAGSGPEEINIQKSVDEHDLQERVHLLGRVADKDLKILYNTVDAFIQPNIKVSGDMEGFGLVLLEAALCNRQVFAAELEGMTDAVISGRNGTLIPAENSGAWIEVMESFVVDPKEVTEARAFTLEKFSWQLYVNHLIAAIS